MSDNAGWYARKMAALRGPHQAQQRPTSVPSARFQPQPQPPQPQQFVQQFQQPQVAPPPVTIDNLWHAMQNWKGGKAHKLDSEPCPECGSSNYYSRSDGARRGPPPAPHCFSCGFNGLFEQGMVTSWQPT